jgi:poly(3-hydroxybutyrate) depolymerase
MMKNRQHQQKGKPHTQEKIQDAAISVEDVIARFRGLNLCGAHWRTRRRHLTEETSEFLAVHIKI